MSTYLFQGGLFEDIADGLRQAKVMIACVSLEYAKSRNCQLEFRFAHVTLKIPIVVVVVGTGYRWEMTEVLVFCKEIIYTIYGVCVDYKYTGTCCCHVRYFSHTPSGWHVVHRAA